MKYKKYLIFVICVVVFFILLDKLIMPWYVGSKEIKVAHVVGLPYQQAFEILKQSGLKPIDGGKRFDSKFPPGTVILQRPNANSIVKEGRNIYLVISSGEQLIEMPNLLMMSLREANLNLTRLGLTLGTVSYDTSSELPKGVIISQSIPPSQKVSKGSTVDLVISSGEEIGEIELPNLIGKSLIDAKLILEALGLKIGKINYQIGVDLLPNTVIDQFPRVGDKVKPNSKVDLFVVKEKISERDFRIE